MAISKATASSVAPAAKGDLVVGSGTNDAAVLAVGTNGYVLTAASGETTGLKWTPNGTFIGCKATQTTATSLTNATYVTVTFDNETIDTNGFHSTSSNNSRITIPTGLGGKYLIVGSCTPDVTSSTGRRIGRIQKNGGDIAFWEVAANANGETTLHLSVLDTAVATDYYELVVFQNSGGAVNTKTGVHTALQVIFLGE